MPCDGLMKRWSLIWQCVMDLECCRMCRLCRLHPGGAHDGAPRAPGGGRRTGTPGLNDACRSASGHPLLATGCGTREARHLTVWSQRRADGGGGGESHRGRAGE